MTEQSYKAVLAVIGDGRTVTEVARDWNISRQTLHEWLGRYEDEGFEGLANRPHRPASCPHQMSTEVEAQLLELCRASNPAPGPTGVLTRRAQQSLSESSSPAE